MIEEVESILRHGAVPSAVLWGRVEHLGCKRYYHAATKRLGVRFERVTGEGGPDHYVACLPESDPA